MFFGDQGATPEQITDGLDNTISIVEVDAEYAVPWTKPADFPIDKKHPAAGLSRDRAGALVVGEANGFVLTLPSGTDTATLWSYFTRAGGEEIDWPAGTTETGLAFARASAAAPHTAKLSAGGVAAAEADPPESTAAPGRGTSHRWRIG